MAYVDGKELEDLELAQALRDRYFKKNCNVLQKMTTAKMNDKQKLIKKIYFRLCDKVAALTDFDEKSEYMQMIEAGCSNEVIISAIDPSPLVNTMRGMTTRNRRSNEMTYANKK